MARIRPADNYKDPRLHPGVAPGAGKPKKGKKPRKGKGGKGHKGHKGASVARVHNAPALRGAADTGDDRVSPAVSGGASPRPALTLDASRLGSAVDGGLLAAVMTLAGSSALGDTGAAALGVWQREQDRIANRAWRRPGGLQRMGGL